MRAVRHPRYLDLLPPGRDVEDRCPKCGKAMKKYGPYYWCYVNWMCGQWFIEDGAEEQPETYESVPSRGEEHGRPEGKQDGEV